MNYCYADVWGRRSTQLDDRNIRRLLRSNEAIIAMSNVARSLDVERRNFLGYNEICGGLVLLIRAFVLPIVIDGDRA
eukprot:7852275-Prorocentrum_lima.AAC.1